MLQRPAMGRRTRKSVRHRLGRRNEKTFLRPICQIAAQQKAGFSIPSQQTLYRDYAAERGISIVREFIDIETAKRVGRREFTKMDKFLREEATKPLEVACRIILVEKVDRLYRNFKDFVSVEELGVEIHFIKEHSVICPGSNSMEKFFHGMMVVKAKS